MLISAIGMSRMTIVPSARSRIISFAANMFGVQPLMMVAPPFTMVSSLKGLLFALNVRHLYTGCLVNSLHLHTFSVENSQMYNL